MTPYYRTAAGAAADAAAADGDGASGSEAGATPSPVHRSHHHYHQQQHHHYQPHYHQHHQNHQHHQHHQPSPHGYSNNRSHYGGGGRAYGGGGGGGSSARSLHPRDHGGPSYHHNHQQGRVRSPYQAAPSRAAAADGPEDEGEGDGQAAWGGPDGDFAAAFAALRLAGAAEDLDGLLQQEADGEAAPKASPSATTTTPPPPTEPVGRTLLRLAARLRPPAEAHASRRALAARVRAALSRLPELQAYPAPESGVYTFSGPGGWAATGGAVEQPDPPAPRGGGGERVVAPGALSTFGSTCTGLFFEDSDVDMCLSGFYWREPPCGSWRRLLPRRKKEKKGETDGGGGDGDGDGNDADGNDDSNNPSDLLIPLHLPHRDPYFDPTDPYYEPGYDGSGYQFEGALAPISAMTPQQSNALLTRALAALRAEGLVDARRETEVVSRARVPVAKWTDARTGLPCDLCLGNHQAVFKSLFLRGLLEGLAGVVGREGGSGSAPRGGGPADACPRLRALAAELKRAEEAGSGSSAYELARRRVAPPPERWFVGRAEGEEDEEEDDEEDEEDEDDEGDDAATKAASSSPPAYLRAPPTLLEALYRLVKLWARQKGANDPARNTLNSWALLQMTVLHLQRRGLGGGGGGGEGGGGDEGGDGDESQKTATTARLLPPLELLFPRSAGGGGATGADRGGALRPLSGVRLQDHGAPYHLLVGLPGRVAALEARGVLVPPAAIVAWASPSSSAGGGCGDNSSTAPLAPVGCVFRGGDEDETGGAPTPAASRLVASELALLFARWSRALHGRLAVRRREADARASTWKGEWLQGRGLFRTNYCLFLEDPFCADDNPARTVGAWNVPGIRPCVSHLARSFRRAEWELRDAVAGARGGGGDRGEDGGKEDGKEEDGKDDGADEAPAVVALFGGGGGGDGRASGRGLFAEAETPPPLVPGQRVFVRGDGTPSLPPGLKAALARAAEELRAAVVVARVVEAKGEEGEGAP